MLFQFFLFLLISYSLNRQCTQEDCEPFNIEGENSAHYICYPLDENNCGWKLLCDYAIKPTEDDESFKCSEQPITNTSINVCIDDTSDSGYPCKEITLCENVIIPLDEINNFDCSKYPLYNKEDIGNKICTENIEEGKCYEEYICGKNPEKESGEVLDCFIYPVSPENKTTHKCTYENEEEFNKCKEEKYRCREIPRPKDGSTIICPEFSTETYKCMDDNSESNNACIETKRCSFVDSNDLINQPDCSLFAVSDPLNYYCKNNNKRNGCNEVYFCLKAPKDDEGDCSNYAVSEENKETHGCVEDLNSETNKCKEVNLCSNVSYIENIDCSKYPVSQENIDSHICVKNDLEGDNPCKEEKLCEYYTKGESDEECRQYPVKIENKGKKACIKYPLINTKGCIEKEYCTTVTKGTGIDCSIYPVSEEKMNTHVCKAISNSGSSKCEEVLKGDLDCFTAEKGDNDEQCSQYKVSSPEKKCVKNTVEDFRASPCAEKNMSECELRKTNATSDEICNQLAVEKEGEEKCIKNPNGDNCMLLTYCEYGKGNSDEDCSKYALKDKKKECKKKINSKKCIEVEPEINFEDIDDKNSILSDESDIGMSVLLSDIKIYNETNNETNNETDTIIENNLNNNNNNGDFILKYIGFYLSLIILLYLY